MKTSKYITSILLFLSSTVFMTEAQDSILNRNVSVEREYRPIIQDAGKISTIPQVLEPKVEKMTAKYSDFNLPLNADFNIHTLPAAELAAEKNIAKQNYARIGFGSYLNTLVDAAFPLINTTDMLLNVSLNHLGTLEVKRFHTSSKADISFSKLFKTFNLYAGVGGGHEYVKYYGNSFNRDSIADFSSIAITQGGSIYSEINRAGVNTSSRLYTVNGLATDPSTDTFWRLNSVVGLHSLALAKDIRYQAEVKYNLFSSINGLTEHQIHTVAKFSSPSKKDRMGLYLDLYNMIYSSTTIPAFNFWNSYSVLNLNPYYSIDREQWNVRLGVKSAVSFVQGNIFSPSADISGEWKLFPKVLTVYAGITGGYELNSLDKTLAENPYLFSDLRVNDTYTPMNLFAGVKAKPFYNVLIDAYVDFRQINNQYFFVNKEYKLNNAFSPMSVADSSLFSNRFNVIYSNATLLKVGVRISYHWQDILNVELKGAYNGWNVATEQYAWNKPKYEAELNVGYKIDKSFSVAANGFYEGGRFAKLGSVAITMPDKMDVNLSVNYQYNKQFSAFAKINNLINSQYQDFYGYDVQGINFMLGAAVSF
jgi:hypothetical protein